MEHGLKMRNGRVLVVIAVMGICLQAKADSIPDGYSRPVEWHIGANISSSFVPGTNGFLKGNNAEGRNIRSHFSADIHTDFSFNHFTREGMLYRGLYQGLGIGLNTFGANRLLGTPVSVYVYQGSPFVHFNSRLWLGYEWQLGTALGWKHYDEEAIEDRVAVSTPVTAHIGLALKLQYSLSDKWKMSFGIEARHFSNGNTSWPNAGVNSIGVMAGVSCVLNPQKEEPLTDKRMEEDADRGHWLYDVIAYGAWRKRVITVGEPAEPQLCPGKFGVLGLQFSPMRQLNRYVAVGPSLDMQWDEGAGLPPYWVNGSSGNDIKFFRPPFGKQLGIGLSAHAELIMPIFSVNAGLGYGLLTPKGDKCFYQSLTLKAFVTRHFFLNAGYRLGNFKDPQNLMVGMGMRL